MKKRILSVFLAAAVAVSLGTCGGTTTPASASSGGSGASNAGKNTCNVIAIIRTTDSSYWQTLLLGAKAAAEESNGRVKVTTDGPVSETDIDKQVATLKNAIAAKPDGIVLASISSTSTTPAVEQTNAAGTPVVTVDNRLETDVYTQHIVTGHAIAATTAAAGMVEQWKAKGTDPTDKKVALISADSGSTVNQTRCEGFTDEIERLVPSIVVLKTQCYNNGIQKALDAADNLVLVNQDLVGVFGDNNHIGNGVTKMMEQDEKGDKIVTYAFDSDDTETDAIQSGSLTGIVVQGPSGMGCNGVSAVVPKLEGKDLKKNKVSETTLVTRKNIQEDAVQKLLYPGKQRIDTFQTCKIRLPKPMVPNLNDWWRKSDFQTWRFVCKRKSSQPSP